LATLFFSYSHRDESLRDEIEKHLTMLKRQGLIEAWHDRRIIAGQPLDEAIGGQLDHADIILLLVSSDFLASEYCYGVEVQRAMERHQRGEAVVIPVVLRRCDWKSAPFGGLLALPRDGKPVVTWPDRDEAFLNITEGIKAALADRAREPRREPVRRGGPGRVARPGVQSGNLDVARTFSEREKDDFLEEAFEQTASLFQNSLAALKERNPGIEIRYRRLDADPRPSPLQEVEAEELGDRLGRALAHLPTARREVVLLSRVAGLGHEDVARVTGQSTGAVRVALHRALRELQARLGPP
jgi:RNA polymerase sigma factor (sigma-70 family)